MVASKGSRKGKRAHASTSKPTPSEAEKSLEDANAQVEEDKVTRKVQPQARANLSDDDETRPTKKRAMSYLDQLLAEKANKKKKKQKGSA